MDDTPLTFPDESKLFQIASGQHGLFTTAQAHESGYRDSLIAYHVKTGRFIRTYRGVYRLRDYPSSPYDEVAAAWLAIGKETAVVSHESALDLLDLSNVNPTAIHLTVPRTHRHPRSLPVVRVHTALRPPSPPDVVTRHGIRVTSPERSIVDAAEHGTAPEQIELAVVEALERGLTTPTRLRNSAEYGSRRVKRLITRALAMAHVPA